MWTSIYLLVTLTTINFCAADKTEEFDKGETSNDKSQVSGKKKVLHALPTEVAIIGAGIAGLAAARKISSDRSNFTVNVYEAQKDRYGGRVWTDKLKNIKAKGIDVDLGASALNTVSKNNPLIALAEDFELKTATLEGLQFFMPWDGKVFSGEDISGITKEAAQILSHALNESRSWKLESSVRDAVDKVLESSNDFSPNSPGAHLVRCLPSYIITDYSTRNYRPEVLDVGYEKVLLDGIGELVDRLVSGSSAEPPLHLHLNKAVRQIKIDEEKKKVLLRFRDGTQIQVDIAVVAVPASVISAQDLMFEPDIPQQYRLAASEMGIAKSNKVIVEFQHAFWPSDIGIFLMAVKEDKDRGYMQSWINIHRIIGKPILATFITGEAAVNFENLTDDEVKHSVIEILTKMFGQEAVQSGGDLVNLQRSQWVSDQFSKGSHTYPQVGTDPKLWETLSKPLCPYIYFVGEHTSFEEHGSLHGAYNSGINAGQLILDHHCEKMRLEEEKRKRREEIKRKKEQSNKSNGKKKKDENISLKGDSKEPSFDDKKDEL